MNKQDAIKELTKAGNGADVRAIIAKHSTRAQQNYEASRSDTRLTESHRRKLLAVDYVRAERELQADLEAAARGVVKIDHDDAATVFGVKGLPGDAASLSISRRDAGDRVASITDEAELTSLLTRATRTGDEILARAVAERATEMQCAPLMNAFIAGRPQLEKAAERLWNVEQAERGWDIGVTVALSEMRAPELSGLGPNDIEHLADTVNDPDPVPTAGRPMFDSESATPTPMATRSQIVQTGGGEY